MAATSFCDQHRAEFLAPIRRRVALRAAGLDLASPIGIGAQCGVLRPDYGPKWAELECTMCGATWVGEIDAPCGWCIDRLEVIRSKQVALLLAGPDVDRDDVRFDALMLAWGERLLRAVSVDLLSDAQASAALRRRIGQVAA